MPRTVSNTFWETLTVRATDEVVLVAVTIDHVRLSEPIRVVCDSENVVSNGETFEGFPFDLTLPGETDDTPRGTIRIENVSQRIGRTIKAIQGPLAFTLQGLLKSDPDTIEWEYRHFTLRKVKVDDLSVQGEIWGHDVAGEPCPARRATQDAMPGLYI